MHGYDVALYRLSVEQTCQRMHGHDAALYRLSVDKKYYES